ncbi:MAG: ORF6N domain-containing protein [bacterium]|nr:ORF6N domain-containing protein [bacterium]
MSQDEENLIKPGALEQRIFIMRGIKVMLDFHLSELYQVDVKRLNEQVKRNIERFPGDFMFQLSYDETEVLMRSQIATASKEKRNARFRPYTFTEHGIAMLSSVLRSSRAIQMNIFIIRAFVKMREMLATNTELALKIGEIEDTQVAHGERLDTVYRIVKKLIEEPISRPGKIGFDAR